MTKKIPTTKTTSHTSPNVSSGSRFQKRPIAIERYRKFFFVGIPGFPNEIPKNLRDKVTKFAGNNAIIGEKHLKTFTDMLNDYKVVHEDVVMKLFIHSLVEDARDWFRRFSDDYLSSWDDMVRCFEEHYGDQRNDGFILN